MSDPVSREEPNAEIDALEWFRAASKTWDDDMVAKVARLYVLTDRIDSMTWIVRQVLQELGRRTHPTVLSLLRDPELRDAAESSAAFSHACDLLRLSPSGEAIDVLAPYLDHSSADVRSEAAFIIARTGATGIVSHVRKALSDPEGQVGAMALIGLRQAVQEPGVVEDVGTALLPDVLHVLREGRDFGTAYAVLLGFDRDLALDVLFSGDAIDRESSVFDEGLRGLADADILVSRDRLIETLEALSARDSSNTGPRVLREVLRLLGSHAHPDDRELLEARMSDVDDGVAEAAAEGLVRWHGLGDVGKRIADVVHDKGEDALTIRQKLWLAVVGCDAEVRNGGFAQYFSNRSGDRWNVAMDGYEAMGLRERFAIVRGAVDLFGPSGPSPDRAGRQEELDEIRRRDPRAFKAFDKRYCQSTESVRIQACRFVLAHSDGFC